MIGLDFRLLSFSTRKEHSHLRPESHGRDAVHNGGDSHRYSIHASSEEAQGYRYSSSSREMHSSRPQLSLTEEIDAVLRPTADGVDDDDVNEEDDDDAETDVNSRSDE
jgi:hypothetical protein